MWHSAAVSKVYFALTMTLALEPTHSVALMMMHVAQTTVFSLPYGVLAGPRLIPVCYVHLIVSAQLYQMTGEQHGRSPANKEEHICIRCFEKYAKVYGFYTKNSSLALPNWKLC